MDAIDTVTAKIELVMQCQKAGVPIISSMGAGNKLDPTQFRVADIYKTQMDPLAKVMRRELKKRGAKKLKVVYSEEKPIESISPPEAEGWNRGRSYKNQRRYGQLLCCDGWKEGDIGRYRKQTMS